MSCYCVSHNRKGHISIMVKAARLTALAVFCLGSYSFAATPGMLYSSGSVSVNGAKTPNTSAIFMGDKVQTASGAAATVSLPGSQVLLPGDTTLMVRDNAVDMGCGSAAVRTTRGLATRTGTAEIRPEGDIARYAVVSNGKSVNVSAMVGHVVVQTAAGKRTLAAGETVSIPENCNLMTASYRAPQQGNAGSSGQSGQSGSTGTGSSSGSSGGASSGAGAGAGAGAGGGVGGATGIAVGATVGVVSTVVTAVATQSIGSPTSPVKP